MAEDYVDLSAVKGRLEIDDTSEDTLITSMITAASRAVDDHCNRRFYLDSAATPRTLNPRRKTWVDEDGEHLIVDDIGSETDLTVELGSSAAGFTDITASIELEPTDAADRDPAEPWTSLLYLRNSFSTFTATERRVRVAAQWGWPAIPAQVQEAAMIQAMRLYKRKDSPEGVLSSPEWGATVRMTRLDPDVGKLLEKLTRPGFA